MPAPSNFYHLLDIMQKLYESPVITYFPVSPVAPPKRTILVFETKVIVCPKRASGTSPNVSSLVILELKPSCFLPTSIFLLNFLNYIILIWFRIYEFETRLIDLNNYYTLV